MVKPLSELDISPEDSNSFYGEEGEE